MSGPCDLPPFKVLGNLMPIPELDRVQSPLEAPGTTPDFHSGIWAHKDPSFAHNLDGNQFESSRDLREVGAGAKPILGSGNSVEGPLQGDEPVGFDTRKMPTDENNSHREKRPNPGPLSYAFDPVHWVALNAPQSYIESLPSNSRLFIGNLASEHTDKTQIAQIFAKYGNIAEIYLKESYGFVQFDCAEACKKAISSEQGRLIANIAIDLKASRDKPTKNGSRRRNGRRGDRGRFSDGRQRSVAGRKEKMRMNNMDNLRQQNGDPFFMMPLMNTQKEEVYGNVNRNFIQNQKWGANVSPEDHQGLKTGMSFYNNRNSEFDMAIPNSEYMMPETPAQNPLQLNNRTNIPECQIVVFGGAPRNYMTHIKNTVFNGNFVFNVMYLPVKTPFREVIYRFASEGVIALILVNWKSPRENNIALYTFANGMESGEYNSIDIDTAVYIMQRERSQALQPRNNYQFDVSQQKFPQQPKIDEERDMNLISSVRSILMNMGESKLSQKGTQAPLLNNVARRGADAPPFKNQIQNIPPNISDVHSRLAPPTQKTVTESNINSMLQLLDTVQRNNADKSARDRNNNVRDPAQESLKVPEIEKLSAASLAERFALLQDPKTTQVHNEQMDILERLKTFYKSQARMQDMLASSLETSSQVTS